jgi:hypothetical protein
VTMVPASWRPWTLVPWVLPVYDLEGRVALMSSVPMVWAASAKQKSTMPTIRDHNMQAKCTFPFAFAKEAGLAPWYYK